MKITGIVLMLILAVGNAEVYGQWNLFYRNYSSDYRGARFISPEVGFNAFSHYLSPSSGSNMSVNRTTDASNSWQNVFYGNPGAGGSLSYISGIRNSPCVFFFSYAGGIGTFYLSADLGANWSSPAHSAYIGYLPIGIYALDSSHFYVPTPSAVTPPTWKIFEFKYGVQQPGIVLINGNLTSLFFTDTLNGYLSVDDTTQHTSILKTTDGGSVWQSVFNDSSSSFNSLFFTSTQTGYAVGDSGRAIKTTNGGQSWQYLNTGINDKLGGLCFANDLSGYVAADSGIILHTTDGGLNWVPEYIGAKERVREIYFVNDTFAFANTFNGVYSNYIKSTTAIEQVVSNTNSLSIYPNPASGRVNVLLPQQIHTENWRLEVIDCTQRLVHSQSIGLDSKSIQISTSALSSGLYVARITDGNISLTSRFVIE